MKRRKKNVNKQPTLLRQLLTIYYEQAQRRKALRILTKQAWSLDFISLMLVRAVKYTGEGVELIIENVNGNVLRLRCTDELRHNADNLDDSILDRLDDEAAIQSFIRQNSRR